MNVHLKQNADGSWTGLLERKGKLHEVHFTAPDGQTWTRDEAKRAYCTWLKRRADYMEGKTLAPLPGPLWKLIDAGDSGFAADQYTALTTWLWYHTHPDFPRDEYGHSSDVCRSIANKVLAFLDTLPEAKPVEP